VRNLVGAINRQDNASEQFDYAELRPVLDAQVERRDLSEKGLLTRFGLIEKDDNDNFQISDSSASSFRRSGSPCRKSGLSLSASRRRLRWAGTISCILANCAMLPRMVAPRRRRRSHCREHFDLRAAGNWQERFVKTLAARLGYSAHFVGEHNGQDAEPDRRERIAALLIAKRARGDS
jgi:hypothetical protein